MNQRIVAEYSLRTAQDPGRVADVIAGEQSSGTFVAIPGESEELKRRSAASVDFLEEIDDSGAPMLPGAVGDGARSYRMTLSWPLANVGPSLPNLLATVAGNLYELREVAGLKLVDLHLPEAFADRYPGPAFGVDGTRQLAGVVDRPFIGTIIKPSIGLDPEETAALADQLCEGGIDFIKDDELQADGAICPFEERLAAVMKVIDRHADRTDRKVMYAVNITGEIDEMLRRHDQVEAAGGTCVMVSLNSVGLAGMSALRRHTRLPIHAHRNGWGYLGRSSDNGWSYVAWHKIWRVVGVDHMHVNGLANKFWEPDDSVIASARACLAPLSKSRPDRVMPVFSSGQSVKQAEGTWRHLGSPDLIYCAGGGIVAHPSGIAAGVRSLRQAWDAAMRGESLQEAAAATPDLAAAVEKFA